MRIVGDELDDVTPDPYRLNVERLIDEIVAQSFPASDPPAWGVVASLLAEGASGEAESGSHSPETHAPG
jgi:hypothetical protein